MKYTIDASGRTIGRVAAEAASVLMGKNTTSFVRNKAPEISVTVTNCGKAKVTEKKQKQKRKVVTLRLLAVERHHQPVFV